MGWEQRGTNRYYYKKEREGSTVKSTYVGRGEIAHMVAQIQSSSSVIEKFARTMKSPKAVEHKQAQTALDELTERISIITQAALLTAGCHTHKRQWRKKRNVRANNCRCHER